MVKNAERATWLLDDGSGSQTPWAFILDDKLHSRTLTGRNVPSPSME